MVSQRQISASTWLKAIGFSVLCHAVIVTAWLQFHTSQPVPVPEFQTTVDGPDEDRPTKIQLDHKPLRRFEFHVRSKNPLTEAPSLLPTSVNFAPEPMGDVKQVSNSSNDQHSLPGTPEIPKLHGRLKAGKTVVYLIDCSSSMGRCLEHAKSVVFASFLQLDPESKFQIFAYNSAAKSCFASPVEASQSNLENAKNWVQQLVAEGRSDHLIGFKASLLAKPDALFLMTDEDDLDQREINIVSKLAPTNLFLFGAIFGKPVSRNADSPLSELIRKHHGTMSWYPTVP